MSYKFYFTQIERIEKNLKENLSISIVFYFKRSG